MMVQRWKMRKSTAGLIGQSPSLWMVTRAVRFQAFHERILAKFEAFLRPPFQLLGPLGWLNLEYLLSPLFFVARFFSDSARTSKLCGAGDAETVTKHIQKSTSSPRNLFEHIWILHQQVGTQTFHLATSGPREAHSFSHMSNKTQSSLPVFKRNAQNVEPPPLWPSPLVHHEGKQRGEARSSFQKPNPSPQFLKRPRLVSASMAGDVLEKTERMTTLQNNGLRASPVAEPIDMAYPLEPSHARLALAPMTIKTPAEGVIFPELEFSGAHQTLSAMPSTGTHQQRDSLWQRGSDEQALQYTQLRVPVTTMTARAQQKINKSVSSQTEQYTASSKSPVSPELSNLEINRMADQVYRLITRKMQIENERQGKWY